MVPVMTRKTTCVLVATILIVLVAATCVILSIWRDRPQKRVKWWLEHSYPIQWNLVPQEQLYFASYQKWSQAGKDIPGIGPILVAMYKKADSEFNKRHLLYAMGAVPIQTTIAFMSDVMLSASSSTLRKAALSYGLLPNIAEPAVQEALLVFVKSSQQSISDRCWVLAELLHARNKDAIAYARLQGQELLSNAETAGVDAKYRNLLAEQMGMLTAASQPGPMDLER